MPTEGKGSNEPNGQAKAPLGDKNDLVDPNSTLHETIAANPLRSMDAYATQFSQQPSSNDNTQASKAPPSKADEGLPSKIPALSSKVNLGAELSG